MASWYRKIDIRVYGDEKFRRLSPLPPSGQSLWLYLLAPPESTPIPGVIRAGRAALAESLGWPLEAFEEAFREVFREGMAEACWESRLVWLPNALRYNFPESPNVIKGWAKHWDAVPECALKLRIYHALAAFFEEDSKERAADVSGSEQRSKTDPEAYLKAFVKAFPKPTGKAFEKASAKASDNPSRKAFSAGASAYAEARARTTTGARTRAGTEASLPPSPPPPTARAREAGADPVADAGAPPPAPPGVRVGGPGEKAELERRPAPAPAPPKGERRTPARLGDLVDRLQSRLGTEPPADQPEGAAAAPPPPAPSSHPAAGRRRPPPTDEAAGDEALGEFAQRLAEAYPKGHLGGTVPFQRALFDAWSARIIRPDGSPPPESDPRSMAAGEVLKRLDGWKAIWAAGRKIPNAANWIRNRQFLEEPPAIEAPSPRNNGRGSAMVNPELAAGSTPDRRANLARVMEESRVRTS